MTKNSLYPPLDPYSTGFLDVDDVHTLYWEQCGNPDGVPIIILHGGPGIGAFSVHRRFFDPDHYRIIIFDQRGVGRSNPFGSIQNNTRSHLVEDIEKLRTHFNISQWHVFGGSWGTTLALSYAVTYPEAVKSFVLRGVFLLEQPEIDWFLYGIQHIFPEAWERFSAYVNHEKDLLTAYYTHLTSDLPDVALSAGIEWTTYESSCASLLYRPDTPLHSDQKKTALTTGLFEAHYFKHEVISPQNSLLMQIHKIRNIPAIIIQGRYDMICPLKTAYALHKAWPEADYIVVPDGGHSSLDPAIRNRLIEATNNMRSIQG